MSALRLSTFSLLLALAPAGVRAQQPPQPARDLVRDVMYNELHDREQDSHWEYRSERLASGETSVREQIETEQGPIFRVLERDGAPLDAADRTREDERLAGFVQDRGQIERVQKEHEEDEQRLGTLIALVPQAFLFTYRPGSSPGTATIDFQPDPAFSPDGYEARIIHALSGTLTVDTRAKRMIDMRGTLGERVDFGYGMLGHVEKGGTFEIHRVQVSPARWKTDLLEVHVQGRILLFRNVSKDQREVRSDFRPVPAGTTLRAAAAMLNEQLAENTHASTPAE